MAIERSALYGKEFQEFLTAHIIRCPRHLPLLERTLISPEDFDFNHCRILLQAAIGILRIQGPGRSRQGIPQQTLLQHLGMMARAKAIRDDEFPAVASLVQKCYAIQLAADYYLPQVEKFLGESRIFKELQKCSLTNPESIPHVLQSTLDRSRLSQRGAAKPLMNLKRSQPRVMVPTGISVIDENLDGGHAKKELGILCAFTGLGKTSLGINFCWGGAQRGFRTALASLELDEEKCMERTYSLIARYPYNMIRGIRDSSNQHISQDQMWDEVHHLVSQNAMGRENNLDIWDFSKDICSISTLSDWIHRDQDQNPDHPLDMLVVDWILMLGENPANFNASKLSGTEVRHKLQRYTDELAKLALKENLALWATHQADPKAEGKAKITVSNSAEGKSAAWRASVYLGVGATEDDRRDGIFTVTASKTRDGKNFCKRIRARLDQQRFEDYNEADEAMEEAGLSADLARAAQ